MPTLTYISKIPTFFFIHFINIYGCCDILFLFGIDFFFFLKGRGKLKRKLYNSNLRQVTNWSPAIGQEQMKKWSQAWDTVRTCNEWSYWRLHKQKSSTCPSVSPKRSKASLKMNCLKRAGVVLGEKCGRKTRRAASIKGAGGEEVDLHLGQTWKSLCEVPASG